MFFQKTNTYTTPEIDAAIKQKGFGIYNYISFDELILTIQRDYLAILSKVNIGFGILTTILGVLAFAGGSFAPLFIFLFIAYAIIFFILILKLIKRSYLFLQVSNVVYTKKGIIIGKDLYEYNDSKNLEEKLLEYEDIFDELLSRPSRLKEVILKKRSHLLDSTTKNGGKVLEVTSRIGGEEGARLMIPVALSYGIYVVLLYIFYYLGSFIGKIVFFPISLALKSILYFKESIEIKIKKKTELIDELLVKMSKSEELIEQKIGGFIDGEIGQMSNFIEKNFGDFYGNVTFVLDEKKALFENIKKSKYNEFIDFVLLESYIKNQFNKPLNKMIQLLAMMEKKIVSGIKNLETSIANNQTIEGNLTKKQIILTHQLDLIRSYKARLSQAVIL